MRGLRMDGDGRLETFTWADSSESLDALQSAVGGWVDVVQLTPQVSMWVNDEGAYLCGMNRPASQMTRLHGDAFPVFGPVAFTGCRGYENETVGLPSSAAAWLGAWRSGRCTSIEERDGRTVACGSVQGHPGVTHENIVNGSRWIWLGSPAHSMADLLEVAG